MEIMNYLWHVQDKNLDPINRLLFQVLLSIISKKSTKFPQAENVYWNIDLTVLYKIVNVTCFITPKCVQNIPNIDISKLN